MNTTLPEMPETTTDRQLVSSALFALGEEINAINRANGWNICEADDWAPSDVGKDDVETYKLSTHIALIHSEASEALEAIRHRDKENFAEEMADVLIRVVDMTHGLGINIADEVAKKLEKNRQRGYRHGGKGC